MNTTQTVPEANGSFVTKQLPGLLSLASVLLTAISIIVLCFAPVFHVDLGKYTPETDDDKAWILAIAPDLEAYADKDFSVNFSFLDYAKDSNKEGALKEAVKNDEAVDEKLTERGAYSAALSAGAIAEYYEKYEEYTAKAAAGDESAHAPTYTRYGDYYKKTTNAGVLVFIFVIFMALMLVIELLVLLVGFAKKVRRIALKGNGIFVFSIIGAALQLLTVVFCIAGSAGLNGLIVLPILFALLAVACPVIAVILYKRAAGQPAVAEPVNDNSDGE